MTRTGPSFSVWLTTPQHNVPHLLHPAAHVREVKLLELSLGDEICLGLGGVGQGKGRSASVEEELRTLSECTVKAWSVASASNRGEKTKR
jgi:rRNA pseudouridine-1189 N-methylase Emg1 (Nep1/Mra1 family)